MSGQEKRARLRRLRIQEEATEELPVVAEVTEPAEEVEDDEDQDA